MFGDLLKNSPQSKLKYDNRGAHPDYKQKIQSDPDRIGEEASGILCDNIKDPHPAFYQAPCETVFNGKNNNYIVCGRDRTGGIHEGFGALGHTQAGMIDIVVGRGGQWAWQEYDESGEQYHMHPSFREELDQKPEDNIEDAARIYISQKTDIDKAFGLKASKGCPQISPRSAIGMKADGIRLIAREAGIRLVTGTSSRNSQGGNITSIQGIDLVAGNMVEKLEPMVKGRALTEALTEIINYVDSLASGLTEYIVNQMEFNAALTSHTHQVPIGAGFLVATPSLPLISPGVKVVTQTAAKTVPSNYLRTFNGGAFKMKYLKNGGPRYINSKFNNTN